MDEMIFSSYEVGLSESYFNSAEISHSWLRSIIYHINCSKPSNETADWSGLSTNLTSKVCFEEKMNDLKNET